MMSWKTFGALALGLAISACASRDAPAIETQPVEVTQSYEAPETEAPSRPKKEIWATTDEGVRHLPSGATCPTKIETYFLVKQSALPGLPEGADVACQFDGTDGGRLTLHLTNFGRDVSPSAHLKGVEIAIRDSHTIAQRTDPPTGSSGLSITRQQSAFILAGTQAGETSPTLTATWIEPVGDWHVKVRAFTPLSEASTLGRAVATLYAKTRNAISSDGV